MILDAVQDRNLDILCEIAKANGASLTLGDLLDLASIDLTEEQLAERLSQSDGLGAKYRIDKGQIVERGRSIPQDEIVSGRDRAMTNAAYANKFARFFKNDEDLRTMSISGSTSYQFAREQDDLDFFCITKNDSVWIFLMKALIRGRIFRKNEKKAPPLCFSYVIEESSALELFKTRREVLFARDSLAVVVLKGSSYYNSLLRENRWMASYFPKIYDNRTSVLTSSGEDGHLEPKQDSFKSRPRPILRKLVNLFLFCTLGNYIRIKSYLLNRKFSDNNEEGRIFKARIQRDRCLFESNDYLELKARYAGFGKHDRR